MRYMISAAALVAALATPAYAQDLSGFRVEARGAWDQVGAKAKLENPDYEDEDDEEFLKASGRDDAFSYGGELGYDFQIDDGVVFGGYVGADWSNGRVCAELIEDDLACGKLKRTFSVGARVGMPLGTTSLLYVKGGYSNGKIQGVYDPDVTDNDDDDPGETYSYSKSRSGFHVGGGLQLGLTENLYGKLEYVYTRLGSGSYSISDDNDDPLLRMRTDRHQVAVGIGVRF